MVEVIVDAGMVLGFFLGLVLVTNKNNKRRSNRILALLLIILSLSIAHSNFIASQIDSPDKIKQPLILVIGPLLLFYFRESAGLQGVNRRDVVHFIPLLAYFVLLMPSSIGGSASSLDAFFVRNAVAMTITIWSLTIVQYGFYWWRVVHLFRKHKSVVESEFSNTEGKTLTWMKSFFHIFGACLGLLAITVFVAVHLGNYSLVTTIVNCTLSVTIFVLGYEGLFQEEVFSNRTTVQTIADGASSMQDIVDVQKVTEEAKKFVPDLLAYMAEKQPYLNEGLTLTDLAKQVGMSRNQLSVVINSGIGDSFYTFINRYRVEEAKRLIANPKNANFTILSLAFEAGFTSKSAFHNTFKKLTGLTPTEYRDTLRLP
jgi:AraC-like DNA-binding protein